MAFDAMQPPLSTAIMALIASPNAAEDMSDTQLAAIGEKTVREYEVDYASMEDWRKRMEAGLALASLVKGEDKTYPWVKASNVKYPLVTTAALMFNAKAYPAIVPSDE